MKLHSRYNRNANIHPDIDKAIAWLEDAVRDDPETDKYGVVAMNILKKMRGDAPTREHFEYKMHKIAHCECGCETEIWKQRENLFFKSLVQPILVPIMSINDAFINGGFSVPDTVLDTINRHLGYLFVGSLQADLKRSRYSLTLHADRHVDQLLFESEDEWQQIELPNGSNWDIHLLVEGPEDISISIYPVVDTDNDGFVTDTLNPEPSNIIVVLEGR